MATPSHTQASAWTADVADVVTITVLNVVAGATLLVGVTCATNSTRTFTVSDSSGDTFTQRIRQQSAAGRSAEIWSADNVAAGTHVFTITPSGACEAFGIVVEVANLDSAGSFNAASGTSDAGSTTSHISAASGAIDTTTDVYCLTIGVGNSVTGGFTAGTNWTSLTASGQNIAQYRISATALTDENGPWTSVNSYIAHSVVASFKGVAAGGATYPGADGCGAW